MARLCALPECHVSFIPKRGWQITCCKEHGARLRYLRRKALQEKLLRASTTLKVEVTTPIKVENPRMSVKVEGIKTGIADSLEYNDPQK